MKNNNETILSQLEVIKNKEGNAYLFDEPQILEMYNNKHLTQSPISVKIMSVIGGIAASLSLVIFYFISSSYESSIGSLLFGLVSFGMAWFLDQHSKSIIQDTILVTTFIMGIIFIGVFFVMLTDNLNLIHTYSILISIVLLFLFSNKISNFISVITIGTGIISWLLTSGWDYYMEDNTMSITLEIITAFIALFLTFWMLYEAKIISKSKVILHRYDPIRIGLIVIFIGSLMMSFFLPSISYLPMEANPFHPVATITFMACLLWTIHYIINKLEIKGFTQRIVIYSISVLIFALSIYAPSILGALLIVLLSYMVNMKTGLVIGLVSLIVFASYYYYLMEVTLLTKSILLMISGGLLLGLFYLQKNTSFLNEKA